MADVSVGCCTCDVLQRNSCGLPFRELVSQVVLGISGMPVGVRKMAVNMSEGKTIRRTNKLDFPNRHSVFRHRRCALPPALEQAKILSK